VFIDHQITAFVISFLVSAAATPVVRLIAQRREFYAVPVADRWHRRPVPLLGGVAIAVAFLVVVAVQPKAVSLAPLLVCSALMLGLGVADDIWSIRPTTKLIGQMLIAGLMLSLSSTVVITGVVVVDQLIAFLWLVGITNAVNLVDNMDGLAAGVAGLAAFGLLALLMPHAGTPLTLAIAAFAGAVLGFLIYNFPPAKIFMGDSGSFFLGFFLAGASVLAVPELGSGHRFAAVAPVLLILFVPIFDTGFVTLTRRLSGRRAMIGGRDHTSHRLVALGVSERTAVLFFYSCAAAGIFLAVALRHLDVRTSVGLVALYLLGVMTLGFVLIHVKEPSADASARPADLPLISEIAQRRRTAEILMDVGLLSLAYYAAFRIRFEEPDFSLFLPPFARSLPFVVGAQVAGLYAAGKYRQQWRNVMVPEVATLLKGLAIGMTASMMLILILYRFERFSRGVFVIDVFIAFFMLIGSRGLMGGVDQYLKKRRANGTPALIFGAGKGGALLVRELLQNPDMNIQPVGFIDDDPEKQHLRIEGIRVLGTSADLATLSSRYTVGEVLISIRDLDAQRLEWTLNVCRRLGLRLRWMRFNVEEIRSVPAAFRHER
jgi:UDP-GlcNAc:undecaprenyl-phosphate/decaprenyl-phosphate GlcNAc-1-phosphate transferase